MSDSKNKKWGRKICIGLVFIIFLASLTALIPRLFTDNEIYITDGGNIFSANYLFCNAENIDNPFFDPGNVIEKRNEIKIIFNNEKPNRISYNYFGHYASNEDAARTEAVSRAKYNLYMSKKGLKPEVLAPTLSIIEDEFRIILYAKWEQISNDTSVFFLLNDSQIDLNSTEHNNLKKFYEDKGFFCESTNSDLNS